jgi:hypothetical protein
LFAFGSIALSGKAKVPIISPEANFGNQFSFCRSVPNNFNASVAKYTDEEKGTGADALPSSSAITQSSRGPKPRPPYSSGIVVPVNPKSTSPFHTELE